MTASSLQSARVSFAAAAAFVVLFAVLHVLKPELDPSWRMGSEYAIGDYGWVMRIAMFALALSCAALFAALRPENETTGGRIALGREPHNCADLASRAARRLQRPVSRLGITALRSRHPLSSRSPARH